VFGVRRLVAAFIQVWIAPTCRRFYSKGPVVKFESGDKVAALQKSTYLSKLTLPAQEKPVHNTFA